MAGHGAEQNGEHYLIPQEFPREEQLQEKAVNQQRTLEKIQARQPLVTLAILDCCRECVDVRAGYHGGKGLTGLPGPAGSLVMYACGTGGYARDRAREGGKHGVFTEALLKHLATPDLDLATMAARVQQEASDLTAGNQVPDLQFGSGLLNLQKIKLVASAGALDTHLSQHERGVAEGVPPAKHRMSETTVLRVAPLRDAATAEMDPDLDAPGSAPPPHW